MNNRFSQLARITNPTSLYKNVGYPVTMTADFIHTASLK